MAPLVACRAVSGIANADGRAIVTQRKVSWRAGQTVKLRVVAVCRRRAIAVVILDQAGADRHRVSRANQILGAIIGDDAVAQIHPRCGGDMYSASLGAGGIAGNSHLRQFGSTRGGPEGNRAAPSGAVSAEGTIAYRYPSPRAYRAAGSRRTSYGIIAEKAVIDRDVPPLRVDRPATFGVIARPAIFKRELIQRQVRSSVPNDAGGIAAVECMSVALDRDI